MSENNQNDNITQPSSQNHDEQSPPYYILKLFIAGHTARSIQAISTIKSCCETYLPGRYQLEIADIYQSPEETQVEQILIVPTLLRKSPIPFRKMVGDISSVEKLRIWLELDPYN